MLKYLIELAENEIPVNLGSLMNTFQLCDESIKYKEYVAFRTTFYGAWIICKIENIQYYIFFMSCETHSIHDTNSKVYDFYKKNDNVIITRIERRDNRDKIFNNTKYCVS